MKTAVIQVRLDSKLKKEADAFFTAAGLDMTSAVRLFLKQTVIRRKLPFEVVEEDPFYSKENQKVLKESIAQLESGKGIVVRKLLED